MMNKLSLQIFSFIVSSILSLTFCGLESRPAKANPLPTNPNLISATRSSQPGLNFINQALIASVNSMGNFPTGFGYSPSITQNGKLACMWSINQILKHAGFKPLGNDTLLVLEAREELRQGRGIEVSQSKAIPGDLAIVDAGGWIQHIGICLNDGCTKVKSNSSSRASFSWISNPKFRYPGSPYNSGKSEIWRLKS